MPSVCDICNLRFRSVRCLETHLATDKHIRQEAFIRQPKYLQTIDEQSKIIEEQSKTIESQLKEIESLECQLDNKDKAQMKRIIEEAKLTERCAQLQEAKNDLLELAKQPKIVYNKTTNKILNYLSSEPIDFSKAQSFLTAELAARGPEMIATAVHDNLLMDKHGKPKVVCTDPSRNKFKFKDPETGELMDDLNLEQTRRKINSQTDFKQLKQDCLDLAQNEAADNECVATLANEFLKSLRLRGKTRNILNRKAREHYLSTAKVNFLDK